MDYHKLSDNLTAEQANANYLGGKSYGLYWMGNSGLPVPPAVCIPTPMYSVYTENPVKAMKDVAKIIPEIKAYLVEKMGYMPLVSVRSGARVSCPGMMDTILNVGLDEHTNNLWTQKLGDTCVKDSFHRLVTMYGSVVKGLDRHDLEKHDSYSIAGYYKRKTGEAFPDADGQILGAIEAVFKSWNNDRAKFYRKMNNIPEDWGTAVTIQAMVFGNLNDQSGTGVLFTRNPDSGENVITGEFLINAQGEDVVAGIRTPLPLASLTAWNPSVSEQLMTLVEKLEKTQQDVQDVEFTVQDGKLFVLQTRAAKRSARAAVKIALDMHTEGLLTAQQTIKRVTARQLDLAQQPVIDPTFKVPPDFTGIPACSGVVSGKAVFSAQAAIDCKEPCILVTAETTPDDIAGMDAAIGVLTMNGGATSHAAVVARGMNKPCVVGLGDHMKAFHANALVTIDGATGRVWFVAVPVIDGCKSGAVQEYLDLVVKTTGIVPVADQPFPSCPDLLIDVGGRLHAPGILKTVIDAASATPGTLYVDCRVEDRPLAEALMTKLLDPNNGLEGAFLKDLEQIVAQLPKGVDSNIVLITSKKTKLPTVGSAKDLRSLILAKGVIALDSGEQLDTKDPAIKQVMAWKASEKLKFLTLGSKAEVGTSAISPLAAIQL
jgi:pyruvate,orthophosphate dikinase